MDAQALVWIDPPSRWGPDLEWIDVAEADRRAADGRFPTGVMLGSALYQVELARQVPAPWVRRAQRVVICDTPNTPWLEALGPGGPQVRFLPAPFGPRSFGNLLGWLSSPLSPGWGLPQESSTPGAGRVILAVADWWYTVRYWWRQGP